VREIRPGIWFIEGENRGRYPFAHSLYVDGEEKILIDTGAGEMLEELSGITGQVVLSHYHRDHVTRNYLFNNAKFFIHRDDAPGVESAEGFYRLSGLNQVDLTLGIKQGRWQFKTRVNSHKNLTLDKNQRRFFILGRFSRNCYGTPSQEHFDLTVDSQGV